LINGLWGSYQHDIIAIASIYLARFEMKSISQVKYKRKQQKVGDSIELKSVANDRLSVYRRIDSATLKECMQHIYRLVYGGAVFPYDTEFESQIKAQE